MTLVNDREVQVYTCERCGFKYSKVQDYAPFLCYRCMRFLAKGIYKLYNQIQPAVSRTEQHDV